MHFGHYCKTGIDSQLGVIFFILDSTGQAEKVKVLVKERTGSLDPQICLQLAIDMACPLS